jgi:hypothetical protein
MGAARGALAGTFLSTLLLLAAGCSYSPNPESGTLMCSVDGGLCPEGYGCTSGFCYKDGEGPSNSRAKFVGRWMFGSPTPQVITCADGGNMNNDLTGDFIEVTNQGAAQLSTFYYCAWTLNLNAAGNATVIVPGTTCSAPEPTVPQLSYTWRGEAFTVTTNDGNTATLNASLPYDKVLAGAAAVPCTMTITSTMTKGTP